MLQNILVHNQSKYNLNPFILKVISKSCNYLKINHQPIVLKSLIDTLNTN